MQLLVIVAVVLLLPSLAHAYIGPGAGITAIGSLIALIGAAALALVGFVWYPIKRLRRGRAKPSDPAAASKDGEAERR